MSFAAQKTLQDAALLICLTNYRKLILISSLTCEILRAASSKYIFSLCWETPLLQQKEKKNTAFLQAVRTAQEAYICCKRETLSSCIFVKQPVANGQEVFLKVLQIYIVFWGLERAFKSQIKQREEKRGHLCSQIAHCWLCIWEGSKSQVLPAQNSIILSLKYSLYDVSFQFVAHKSVLLPALHRRPKRL